MSVRRVTRRNPKTGTTREFLQVDIVFEHADGRVERVRKVSPVQTKRGAEEYERRLRMELLHPTPKAQHKEVPTLEAFAPRFIEGYAQANRQKASGVQSKQSILKNHLLPLWGRRSLDEISDEQVAKLKARLRDKSRKTTNNVLTVLGKLLKVAVKWKLLDAMPCAVELVKVSNPTPEFYEFEDYARLVEAADKIGTRELLVVLLGGDAGLRRGEMMALRWSDVDSRRGQLRIEHAAFRRSKRAAREENAPQWTLDTPKCVFRADPGGRSRRHSGADSDVTRGPIPEHPGADSGALGGSFRATRGPFPETPGRAARAVATPSRTRARCRSDCRRP